MKRRIITSGISVKRDYRLAFFLSFLFTGLGQVYNGDFSRGMVFCIFRVLSFLFIPFCVVLNNCDTVKLFATAFIVHFFVWLASSVEAGMSARRKSVFSLRKYNSTFFYIFYSIFVTVSLTFTVLFVFFFFSVERVNSGIMNPAIFKGEYVLVNKYAAEEVKAGDIVLHIKEGKKSYSRIVAESGEVSMRGSKLFIDDTPLELSIINDESRERMALRNREDLFYETNGDRTYPVLVSLKGLDKGEQPLTEKFLVKENMFFAVFDNRTNSIVHEISEKESVKGRIEGIIYSSEFSRIMLKPWMQKD